MIQANAYINPWCAYLFLPSLALLLHNLPKKHKDFNYGRYYYFGLLSSSSYWLIYPLHDMVGLAWPIAIPALTSAFILVAILLDLSFVLNNRTPPWLSYAWIIACSEYLRQYTFLALPWSFTGYVAMHLPIAPLIPYSSVFTLSYILIQCAMSITTVYRKPLEGSIQYSIVFGLLGIMYYTMPAVLTQTNNTIALNIIQPNLDLESKQDPIKVANRLSTLIAKAKPHTLSILPEASLHLNLNSVTLDAFMNSLKDRSALIGISYNKPPEYENHISIIGTGEAEGTYHKQRRVPFGEMLPGLDTLYPLIAYLGINTPQLQSMHTPTNIPKSTLLNYHKQAFYPMLCYEVFFPVIDSTQQSQATLNIISAENTFYANSRLHDMLSSAAKFQALQSMKPTVLATNRGPSVIYNNQGKIQAKTTYDNDTILTTQTTTNYTQNSYHSGYDSVIIIVLLAIDWLSYQCRTMMVYYARQLLSQRHRTTSQTSVA